MMKILMVLTSHDELGDTGYDALFYPGGLSRRVVFLKM